MSSPHSPDPRGSAGPSSADLPRLVSRTGTRFGFLSHNMFFSRHNPHPNRVKHIQGLNGRPVCTVRDEWFVTSSLFPHPLLKGRQGPHLPPALNLFGASGSRTKSQLLSDRWRDELKEMATRILMSSNPQKDKKEDPPAEEEPIRRQTQYSAQTGRIIPSSSRSQQRRSFSRSQPQGHQQAFLQDQELMVLERLCQILQTDSFSHVQLWLVLAGQREKDHVMELIKKSLDGIDLQNQDLRLYPHLPPQYNPNVDPTWQPQQRSRKQPSSAGHATPEKIGDAEVLQLRDADEREDDITAE